MSESVQPPQTGSDGGASPQPAAAKHPYVQATEAMLAGDYDTAHQQYGRAAYGLTLGPQSPERDILQARVLWETAYCSIRRGVRWAAPELFGDVWEELAEANTHIEEALGRTGISEKQRQEAIILRGLAISMYARAATAQDVTLTDASASNAKPLRYLYPARSAIGQKMRGHESFPFPDAALLYEAAHRYLGRTGSIGAISNSSRAALHATIKMDSKAVKRWTDQSMRDLAWVALRHPLQLRQAIRFRANIQQYLASSEAAQQYILQSP